MPATKTDLRLYLGLILGTILLFSPVFFAGFIDFDDPDYVTTNRMVQKGLSSEGVVWAFTTSHASNWHPLTWLSHMVDWQLFGAWPAGHHVTSLLLHVFNTLLVFAFLKRTTGSRWKSAIVAALFGWHPMHVESVAWVSERKDVLSTFFGLLALLFYARHASAGKDRVFTPNYFAALLFFALSLMAKPMVVTLPFVLLLLDVWPLGRLPVDRLKDWASPVGGRLFLEKAPFFGLVAASSAVTLYVQKTGGAVVPLEAFPLSGRLASVVAAYVRYLGKAFAPHDLSIFYPPIRWPGLAVFGAVLLLAGISWLAIHWRKQRPYVAVGWFWFLGTLVPVIGLVQVGMQSMADRYSYFSLIGLAIAVTWTVSSAAAVQRKLWFGGAAVVLCVLGALTFQRAGQWKDSATLFRQALDVDPNNYWAHTRLGCLAAERGNMKEAVAFHEQALSLEPGYEPAHSALGFALLEQGQIEKAMDHLETALSIRPNNPDTLNNLAKALAMQGQTEESLKLVRQASEQKPFDANIANNFGNALMASGRLPEAIAEYERALQLNPRFSVASRNLATALLAAGRYADAAKAYERAIVLNEQDLDSMNNLAWILATSPDDKVRDGAKAVSLAEQVVARTERKVPRYLGTLDAAYAESGRFEEAIQTAQAAVHLARQLSEEELARAAESRLSLYRRRQPVREAAAPLGRD